MPDRAVTPHRDTATLVTGHFRERPGYASWRPDGTRDWLLILTLAGGGRFGAGGGDDAIVTTAGDLVLLKPNTLHDYSVALGAARWELLWTHFNPRPAWLDWLDWPKVAPGLMRLRPDVASVRRAIADRFADAHRLATGPLRRRDELAMNALEAVLLWCDAANPRAAGDAIDPRIRAATDWLCRNLKAAVTLDALADVVGMSASRLAHLFREQVNVPPLQYLEMQRMRRARQLLAVSELSVKQIAAEVGFDDPFYFTNRFRKSEGTSPTAFRAARSTTVSRASSRNPP